MGYDRQSRLWTPFVEANCPATQRSGSWVRGLPSCSSTQSTRKKAIPLPESKPVLTNHGEEHHEKGAAPARFPA